jgi:hypothetical protein
MPGKAGQNGGSGGGPNEGVSPSASGGAGNFGLRCIDDDNYIQNVAWLHTDVSIEKSASMPFAKTDAGGAGYLLNLAPGQFLNPGSGETLMFDSLRYFVQRGGKLACHSTSTGNSIAGTAQVPLGAAYSGSSEVLYIALAAEDYSEADYDHSDLIMYAGQGQGVVELYLDPVTGYPNWFDNYDNSTVVPKQLSGVPVDAVIDRENLALTVDAVWDGTHYIPRVRFGSGPWIDEWVYETTGEPWLGNASSDFTYAAGLYLGNHAFTAFRVVALKDGSHPNSDSREAFFDSPDDKALVKYIESQI